MMTGLSLQCPTTTKISAKTFKHSDILSLLNSFLKQVLLNVHTYSFLGCYKTKRGKHELQTGSDTDHTDRIDTDTPVADSHIHSTASTFTFSHLAHTLIQSDLQ